MTSFDQEQKNQSLTPLTRVLAAAAALVFMVATVAACSNGEDEQEGSDSSSSSSEENESSDSSSPTEEGESSDSSSPSAEENETPETETGSENLTLTGLSYCEIAAQWQEAYENSFPSDGPSRLEYVTAVAAAAPAEVILSKWETYRDALTAFIAGDPLPAGVDLDALRAELRNHIEVTCDLVFSTAPTADADFAGCWARAIWLIGWGVDQDILNDPNQYQQILNTALTTKDATILFPVIEELYALLGTPPASGTGPGYGSCAPFD
jgi:hypothetical protein